MQHFAIKFQFPKEINKKCRNPQRFFVEKRQDSQRNTSYICRKSQYEQSNSPD